MISVVIPAHNAACTLDECLQAIDRSGCEHEIIVVDDASADDTAQVAKRHLCRTAPRRRGRVIRLTENLGAARAKNRGASEATGDIILFTDADILLQPDTLDVVAEHFQDPTVAGVVGLFGQRLRYRDFGSQFKNLWMHYTYTRLAADPRAQQGVGVFLTSIAAIRKDVFAGLGGFDPNYRGASITEDIEFGQRLLTAGQKVRLDARLTVEHLKHYSLGGVLNTDLQRALGLTKTWLRKKLDPAQRASGQKYYASVPVSFILGVPLAWMLPLFVLLALSGLARDERWTRQLLLSSVALLDCAGILLLNAHFLNALRQARGWWFGLQCCLFLPVDLWVSGLGVLWAVTDYMRGNRY